MLKVGVTPEVNAVSTLLLLLTVCADRHRPATATGADTQRRDQEMNRTKAALSTLFGPTALVTVLATLLITGLVGGFGRLRQEGQRRAGGDPGEGRWQAQHLHLVRLPAEGGHRQVLGPDRHPGQLRRLRLQRGAAREAPVRRRRLRSGRAFGLHGQDPRRREAHPADRPRRSSPTSRTSTRASSTRSSTPRTSTRCPTSGARPASDTTRPSSAPSTAGRRSSMPRTRAAS